MRNIARGKVPDTYAVQELQEDWQKTLKAIAYAVGRAAGWTSDEISDKVGVGRRTMFKHLSQWDSAVKEIEAAVGPFVKVKRTEVKEIAVEHAAKEMEKLLGKAIQAICNAIDNGDTKTASENAWRLYYQIIGKPASRFEGTLNTTVRGQVNHTHTHYQMPAPVLKALEVDALADQMLTRRAMQLEGLPILDVDPITDNDGTN